MKEHPLLLSAPMVQAMLAGRKRVTRRILSMRNTLIDGKPWSKSKCKWPSLDFDSAGYYCQDSLGKLTAIRAICCRHGCDRSAHNIEPIYQLGDAIWFKETWWKIPEPSLKDIREGADTWPKPIGPQEQRIAYFADGDDQDVVRDWGWRLRPSIFMPRWASRLVRPVLSARIEQLQEITEADAILEGFGPRSARALFIGLWGELRPTPGQRWQDNPLVIRIELGDEVAK